MNPFRSVGGRLGIALALLVAGALGLADLIVVPTLERNLVDGKVNQLAEAAPRVGRQVENSESFELDDTLQSASASSNARIVYFTPINFNPPKLSVYDESPSLPAADVEDDPLALRAFTLDRAVSGTVSSRGQRFAEAAHPLPGGAVVLLRSSLHDSLRSVALVRRRLLIAGLIALAASLLVGYLAAAVFARRIRRLERAADRIAGGDFGEPVVDGGSDELGQLAAAFERMRLRLAQLEHARREFIANASHELRTPLFSLGGFVELMEEDDVDPATQAEFLAAMREQIDRLTRLATDLLDLSRLDTGRLRVEREPFDLTVLAHTLGSEFHARARSSGHDLQVVAEDEAPAIGDEGRALQIGRLLLENALVHSPSGTSIRVGTGWRSGSVALAVEDEGPGIAPEHAPHVFERFYRAEGSVASGSGLGLAIARELAELMGGSVELQSVAERTIFTLVLPRATRLAGLENGHAFSREIAELSETRTADA